MIHSIWAFVQRVVLSHLGHVLLAVSWTFILLVFVRWPLYQPQLVECVPQGDEVYTIVEILRTYPIWTVAIWVAHFPSMFATVSVTKLLQIVFSLSCGPSAKVELPLLFLFSTVQWLMVGYIIDSLLRWWRSRT